MKKSSAIKILKKQILKLDKLDDKTKFSRTWYVQSQSYILSFFGEKSNEYIHFCNIAVNNKYSSDQTQFINNCIETISDIGLHKPLSIWKRIDSLNQNLVWTIFVFIISFVFVSGTIVGFIRKDCPAIIHKSDNKTNLKDHNTKHNIIKNIHNDSLMINKNYTKCYI